LNVKKREKTSAFNRKKSVEARPQKQGEVKKKKRRGKPSVSFFAQGGGGGAVSLLSGEKKIQRKGGGGGEGGGKLVCVPIGKRRGHPQKRSRPYTSRKRGGPLKTAVP